MTEAITILGREKIASRRTDIAMHRGEALSKIAIMAPCAWLMTGVATQSC